MVFTTIPTADGGLATSRGSADFTMRLASDDALAVERDAGVRETLQRVTPGAALPADLPGRYQNPDTAATWTISTAATGMTLAFAGPLLSSGSWEIEPIEGDFIRDDHPDDAVSRHGWMGVCCATAQAGLPACTSMAAASEGAAVYPAPMSRRGCNPSTATC